jgi:hypothetical protein
MAQILLNSTVGRPVYLPSVRMICDAAAVIHEEYLDEGAK